MFIRRLLRFGNTEHLHLLKLVDPEDTSHVFAVRTCLLPEARAEACEPDRQFGRLQPLVILHGRQRLFRCGNHVHGQVVIGRIRIFRSGPLALYLVQCLILVSQLSHHAHQVLLHELRTLDRQEPLVGQECDAVVVQCHV